MQPLSWLLLVRSKDRYVPRKALRLAPSAAVIEDTLQLSGTEHLQWPCLSWMLFREKTWSRGWVCSFGAVHWAFLLSCSCPSLSLLRCEVGTNNWSQCNDTPVKFARFPVTGLIEGRSYIFRVRAVNKNGIGLPSRVSEPVAALDPAEKARLRSKHFSCFRTFFLEPQYIALQGRSSPFH